MRTVTPPLRQMISDAPAQSQRLDYPKVSGEEIPVQMGDFRSAAQCRQTLLRDQHVLRVVPTAHAECHR